MFVPRRHNAFALDDAVLIGNQQQSHHPQPRSRSCNPTSRLPLTYLRRLLHPPSGPDLKGKLHLLIPLLNNVNSNRSTSAPPNATFRLPTRTSLNSLEMSGSSRASPGHRSRPCLLSFVSLLIAVYVPAHHCSRPCLSPFVSPLVAVCVPACRRSRSLPDSSPPTSPFINIHTSAHRRSHLRSSPFVPLILPPLVIFLTFYSSSPLPPLI